MTVLSRTWHLWRAQGLHAVAQRAARAAYRATDAQHLEEPLLDGDVADSRMLDLPLPGAPPTRDRPLRIGWVTVPPKAGSGGHTTLFRMVAAAEAAGHRCDLVLYDRFDGDLAAQERVIRQWWPQLKAGVRSAREPRWGLDVVVASSWDTAHVVARHREPMQRCYFIQDFEPYFYPRGSEYALAEDTYRFGFRNIALGEMVAGLIRREVGAPVETVQFGCDQQTYHPTEPPVERRGVVMYARPGVARRGFWLARLALARFHRTHPEVPLHSYGSVLDDLPFPITQHGRLTPRELNDLYQRCRAGLAMSFTNISLVAEEMLAAGVIPVVNDSDMARADLNSPAVVWARPTPEGIARALRAIIEGSGVASPEAAAASVRSEGWQPAQRAVVQLIEETAYQPVTR